MKIVVDDLVALQQRKFVEQHFGVLLDLACFFHSGKISGGVNLQ